MHNVLDFRGSDPIFSSAKKNFGPFNQESHGRMIAKVIGALSPSERRQLLGWSQREFGFGRPSPEAINTGVYSALSFAALEANTTPDDIAEVVIMKKSAFGIFL